MRFLFVGVLLFCASGFSEESSRGAPPANTERAQAVAAQTMLARARLSEDAELTVTDQGEERERDGRLLPAVIAVQISGQSWQTLGPGGARVGLPCPGPKPLADMAIQVWALRADGTLLPPRGKPSFVCFSNAGYTTDIMSMHFEHAAPKDLAGVVVRAGGKLFVVDIKP